MDGEQSSDAFARVLDEIAEAEAAGHAQFRMRDETWALLASRIALAMSTDATAAQLSPNALHRRFIDPDRDESVDERVQSASPLQDVIHLPGDLSRAELERIRRLFARVNHPDRVAPADREAANTRMAAFNRLIDDRIARHRRAS